MRRVLYLIFNEAYTASWGRQIQRTVLASEAIRPARMLERDDRLAGGHAGRRGDRHRPASAGAATTRSSPGQDVTAPPAPYLWLEASVAPGASVTTRVRP